MKVTAILAMDASRLIGSQNGLPWNVPEDLQHFSTLTKGNTVVMGRKTYESLPPKYRPLPHRKNIVITRNHIEGIETYLSIDAFVEKYHNSSEKIFLIGGAQLYNAFFQKKLVDTVELTLIDGLHEGDTFVDEFRNDFSEIARTDFKGGTFITLTRS